MNKKGFTLIELLAVIVVLGLVIAIAIPTIGGITKTIQDNMREEKLTIIEEAATLYGEDRRGAIMNSTQKYNSYNCKSIKVSDLVNEKYLDKDNDNNCITASNPRGGCIVDPSDESHYLDNLEVIIYYRNKRIKAIVDIDDNLVCR